MQIVNSIFKLSESRGKEASGLAVRFKDSIYVLKEPITSSKLVRTSSYKELFNKTLKDDAYKANQLQAPILILGHSRLQTNGQSEINTNNQPVVKDGAIGIHNGIIVNDDKLWKLFPTLKKKYDVDTEVFLSLLQSFRTQGGSLTGAVRDVFDYIEGFSLSNPCPARTEALAGRITREEPASLTLGRVGRVARTPVTVARVDGGTILVHGTPTLGAANLLPQLVASARGGVGTNVQPRLAPARHRRVGTRNAISAILRVQLHDRKRRVLAQPEDHLRVTERVLAVAAVMLAHKRYSIGLFQSVKCLTTESRASCLLANPTIDIIGLPLTVANHRPSSSSNEQIRI